MNASVAVVIVGDESNMSLSWTTNYPTVLLTDELSVSDDKNHDRCNNFGRVAAKGTSRHCVLLSRYYWTVDNANLFRFTRRSYHLD